MSCGSGPGGELCFRLRDRGPQSRRVYDIRVPKSVVRLSVDRSRIKRLIREAMRLRPRPIPEGKILQIVVKIKFPKKMRLGDLLSGAWSGNSGVIR